MARSMAIRPVRPPATGSPSVGRRWLPCRLMSVEGGFGDSGRSRVIIESFSAFADQSAANKPFESADLGMIFRRGEAKRLADGQRAASTPNAMDIILRMLR